MPRSLLSFLQQFVCIGMLHAIGVLAFLAPFGGLVPFADARGTSAPEPPAFFERMASTLAGGAGVFCSLAFAV